MGWHRGSHRRREGVTWTGEAGATSVLPPVRRGGVSGVLETGNLYKQKLPSSVGTPVWEPVSACHLPCDLG